MYEIGLAWAQENCEYKRDVHIVREGLNLYGEYYDYGYSKAVIILSGRTESHDYGYYFAPPYAQSGYNVLVIDPRAHGMSDGVYNTVGFEESKDALQWAELLHHTYHVQSIVFHGICIGAAGAMFAITSEECPDYISGLVTEGMFPNFAQTMKNHLIERKKMLFPVLHLIDLQMRMRTGHSMKKGPIDVIIRLNKPILMLQSLQDQYSTADNAKKMFDLCPSEHKELVLFDEGKHSMLRITDTAKYDRAIVCFLDQI